MPKKKSKKNRLPSNTAKPWSPSKIAAYLLGFFLLLAWCTGGDDNGSGSGSKKSTMNKVYLSSDPVYYNTKFGQVLRHCNYENGEMLEMAPSVQCPAFLLRTK